MVAGRGGSLRAHKLAPIRSRSRAAASRILWPKVTPGLVISVPGRCLGNEFTYPRNRGHADLRTLGTEGTQVYVPSEPRVRSTGVFQLEGSWITVQRPSDHCLGARGSLPGGPLVTTRGPMDHSPKPWITAHMPWLIPRSPWITGSDPWALGSDPWDLVGDPWALGSGPLALASALFKHPGIAAGGGIIYFQFCRTREW